MSNLLLRQLREAGVIVGEVLPFASPGNIDRVQANHLDSVIMDMGKDVRPGPYWLVKKEDAERMQAQGYEVLAPQARQA